MAEVVITDETLKAVREVLVNYEFAVRRSSASDNEIAQMGAIFMILRALKCDFAPELSERYERLITKT